MSANMQASFDPSLDTALDDCLADRWPPATWQRIRRIDDLPWRFEQLARTLPSDSWCAYSDGVRLGFAVGRFAEMTGSGPDCVHLAVSFYDPACRLCAAGVWRADTTGDWSLHSPLP